MRDSVFVRMKKDHVLSLGLAVSQMPDGKARQSLAEFLREAEKYFDEDPDDAIKIARQEYASDEIEVDNDAPLSRSHEGVWVGGWLFVSNEDKLAEEL